MSIILNPHHFCTESLLGAINPRTSGDWYFTFVGRNYSLGLKTHFLSSLRTERQNIKNNINTFTRKNINYITMVFDEKNWNTLLDKSAKNELFLECLFGNTDTMIPICRLPVICPSIKYYYLSKSDISSKFEGVFNRIHIKTKINNKGKYVIRIAIERS